MFQDCVLGDCNRFVNDENYLNFDLLCPNQEEYKFKFIWNDGLILPEDKLPKDGDYAMEWTQPINPISAKDIDMNSERELGAILYPSGNTPYSFSGLSLSSTEGVLLRSVSGVKGYLVGYTPHPSWDTTWVTGVEAYVYNPHYGHDNDAKSARKVQLFVSGCVDECVGGTHNCDLLETCINTADGFTCECKSSILELPC